MKVKDIMSTQVEAIEPHLSLRSAARKMNELNLGSMPVVEDGKLLGIITDRDISVFAIAMGHGSESTEVRKMMTKDVFTCTGGQDLAEAALIMEQK
jgi:CBS domain-containing protein